jgi:ATP-binding cassette, subfamily B, bacterial
MSFVLKKKKYGWRDFLIIPYQCDQLSTVALGVQKLLTALSAVLQVPIVAKFIDTAILSVQGKAELSQALPWFILLVLCVGWRRISYLIGRFFSTRLQINAGTILGIVFTDKRSRLQYRHIENPETWNLINRVCTKADVNVSLMIQRTYNLLLFIIRIFGVLFIVFTQVWWIGVLTSILCVPLIILSLRGGKNNYQATKVTAQYERRHQYLADVLSGREAADERTLFGYSDHLNRIWFEQFEASRKIKLKADMKMMASVRGGSIIATILSSGITLALIIPTSSGQITVGMFIALATSMFDLITMVGQDMTRAVSQLSKFNAYMKDLTDFAYLEETKHADCLPNRSIEPFAVLEFKNVSFSYPGTKTILLKNVNLKIDNTNQYAFVGANGAGKTTIIKLITGLYDNYEGEILINGKELKLYSQGELKALFSGVYQDFAKYYISIKQNILIGNINGLEDPDNDGKMVQILQKLGLYDDLSMLPKGLDSTLGKILDNGVDLSGGQWQKLAMARSLMNPAPILIFDEPTAALDPISESRLYEQFEDISRGKTSIFISHRLGSTKLVNKIFVLENGEVVEEGSHDELMSMHGIYTRMYDSQRDWYQ